VPKIVEQSCWFWNNFPLRYKWIFDRVVLINRNFTLFIILKVVWHSVLRWILWLLVLFTLLGKRGVTDKHAYKIIYVDILNQILKNYYVMIRHKVFKDTSSIMFDMIYPNTQISLMWRVIQCTINTWHLGINLTHNFGQNFVALTT